MAYPTIVFNSDTGSGGNSASGAGPATAIVGTCARHRSADLTRIGFFESDPDLSLVEVDGSHVLQVAATGRQWSRILAKKVYSLTTTGTATIPTDTITVVEPEDMQVGDLVRIAGGGDTGSDLVTMIDEIDGNDLVLHDSILTSVEDAEVFVPVQVTVEDELSISDDSEWSIGGERGMIDGSLQLFADLKPGWTVELAGTANYTILATLTLTAAGDTTNGRITVYHSGSGRLVAPSASDPFFELQADLWKFRSCKAGTASDLVLIDSSDVQNTILEDCTSEETGMRLVRVSSAVTGGYLTFRGGRLDYSSVQVDGVLEMLRVEATYVKVPTAGANDGIVISTATPLTCTDSIFDHCLDAIDLGSAAGRRAPTVIERCVFPGTTRSCIVAGHLDAVRGLVVRHCAFDAQVYHLELPAGADAVVAHVDYNEHVDSARLQNITQGEHDTIIADFGFRDRDAEDYRRDMTGRGTGWPTALPAGDSVTSFDRGAVQAAPPVGGSIIARIDNVTEDATNYTVTYLLVGGNLDGCYRSVVIAKTALQASGDYEPEAVEGACLAWLREHYTGDLTDLVGQEVLC